MDRYLSRAADDAMDTVQSLIAEIEKLEEIIEDLTSDIDKLDADNVALGVKYGETLHENLELRHQIIDLEKDLADLSKTVQSLI